MEHAPKKVGVHEAATLYGWLVLHTTPRSVSASNMALFLAITDESVEGFRPTLPCCRIES